ncbi:carboxypeptidase regulatory-like domain-containing protein [Agromyces italicus]|uniref:carboxypeptidase regulatory-like domain-containing protein n=1 Tax=Agromyces italicus TaxID=279572 RepID=UPI0012F9A6FB|nr:carboxypeptidase regulatory-like domain-containing protein [Agromyces italicus]
MAGLSVAVTTLVTAPVAVAAEPAWSLSKIGEYDFTQAMALGDGWDATAISPDGRYLVTSDARAEGRALLLIDTQTQASRLVNAYPHGSGSIGASWEAGRAQVSTGGRYVAFTENVKNLPKPAVGTDASFWTYVYDAESETVTPVPTTPELPRFNELVLVDMSADASVMLLRNDDNGRRLFVTKRDGATMTTKLLMELPAPARSSDVQRYPYPQLSDDGTRVMLHDLTGEGSVALYDITGEAPVLEWSEAAYVGSEPSPYFRTARLGLSADGSVVAWASRPQSWPTADVPFTITILDRTTGDRRELEVPERWLRFVGGLTLSADGSALAAVVARPAAGLDVFAFDTATGAAELVSAPADGGDPFPGGRETSTLRSLAPQISADGARITFNTDNDLITGVRSGPRNAYLAESRSATAPVWPDGSAVRLVEAGAEFVRVEWDAASDTMGVDDYLVSVDGQLVTTVPAATRATLLDGLAADTAYRIAVEPRNIAGQIGAPLELEVRTGAVLIGDAALTGSAAADGRVTLRWDSVGADATYRVVRTVGGASKTVGETAAATFVDTGVPAGVDVEYRVELVSGETTVRLTRSFAVATPALPAPVVSWSAPKLSTGHLALGSTLAVQVTGQPDRTVTAELRLGTLFGEEVVTLDFVEQTDGRYTASHPLVAGPVNRVVALAVAIDDGEGHEATAEATGLPASLSGALRLDFAGAAIAGDVLTVASASAEFSHQQLLTAEPTVTVPVPPADDLRAEVRRANGSLAASSTGLSAIPAAETFVELRLAAEATLDVEVRIAGGEPLRDAVVEVSGRDGATSGRTDSLGVARSSGWQGGDTVGVRVTSSALPIEAQPDVEVVLVAGANHVVVEVTPVGAAIITGIIRENGEPIAGATVTLSQTIAGQNLVRVATTGDDGRFALEGYVGASTLRVSTPSGGSATRQHILDATNDVLIDVEPLAFETVRVDLRMKPPGEPEWGPPVGIDWSTSVHLKVDADTSAVRLGTFNESSATISGAVGTEVRICADAVQVSGPAGCSEPFTLTGEAKIHEVDLRLGWPAGIQATLLDGNHEPLTGSWTATLMGEEWSTAISGNGSAFSAQLPAAGRYVIAINHSGSRAAAWKAVDVENDTVTQLGEIVINEVVGAFTGDGNSVVALDKPAPGETVEIRIEFAATVAVRGAQLRLTTPAGWEVLPAGTILDGSPVTARSGLGGLTVRLGDLAAGDTGVLRVTLRVPADASVGVGQRVTALVSAGTGGEHVVGSTVVDVAGVTIHGPERISEFTAVLSGLAPAGAEVSITERGTVVGVATAGPGGRWETRVDLPERRLFWGYEFQASAVGDGRSMFSNTIMVEYDPTAPALTEIAVHQNAVGSSGRTIRFDPRDGVAVFPFVVVDGDVTVGLTFDRPDQVDGAVVKLGAYEVEAIRGLDGRFTATIPLRLGNEGPISVDVTSRAEPLMLDDPRLVVPSDEATIRELMPVGMRDFVITDVTPVSNENGTGERITVLFPSLPPADGEPVVGVLTRVVEEVDVELTDDDRRLMEQTGVPIAGFEFEAAPGGNGGSMEVILPADGSSFEPVEGVASAASVSMTPSGRAAASTALFRPGFKTALDWAFKADAAESARTAGDKYEALSKLKDRINNVKSSCQYDYDMSYWEDAVDDVGKQSMALDGLNALAMATSVNTGPAAEFVYSALTYVGDKTMGKLLEHQINQIDEHVTGTEKNCGETPEERMERMQEAWQPIADPEYIYDPSGFVYEGAEANRLEGVTATVLHAPTAEGPWEVWNAEWYGQWNPVLTDAEGRYAWDVPIGFWQVRYEAEGYAPAKSDVLEVLPPHVDVNVGLVPLAAPTATGLTATGELVLTFSQLMQAASVTTDSVSVMVGGVPVSGSITPIEPLETPDGAPIARSFTFTPGEAFVPGTELEMHVLASARNHAGRAMESDAMLIAVFEAAPVDPADPGEPGGDGSGSGSNPGGGTAAGATDGVATSGTKGPRRLSDTGASLIALPIGLGLLALGVVFVVARRRRSGRADEASRSASRSTSPGLVAAARE